MLVAEVHMPPPWTVLSGSRYMWRHPCLRVRIGTACIMSQCSIHYDHGLSAPDLTYLK